MWPFIEWHASCVYSHVVSGNPLTVLSSHTTYSFFFQMRRVPFKLLQAEGETQTGGYLTSRTRNVGHKTPSRTMYNTSAWNATAEQQRFMRCRCYVTPCGGHSIGTSSTLVVSVCLWVSDSAQDWYMWLYVLYYPAGFSTPMEHSNMYRWRTNSASKLRGCHRAVVCVCRFSDTESCCIHNAWILNLLLRDTLYLFKKKERKKRNAHRTKCSTLKVLAVV